MRGNILTRLQLALIRSAVFEEWPTVLRSVFTKLFSRRNHTSATTIAATVFNVRFTPESGHSPVALQCPVSANSGHRRQLTRNVRLPHSAM